MIVKVGGSAFEIVDIMSLLCFCAAWVCYSQAAEYLSKRKVSLLTVMNDYRLLWMREMLKRENRMMDATMIGNLLRSIAFFANTSIFILIGLVTMLRYRDEATAILETIPFAQQSSALLWEIKIFLLAVIFAYAFFKYTWSLRQYNYACIVVAGAPSCKDKPERHEDYAQKAAKLIANAARHFNMGLRAYYFGLAALSWFISAWAFIICTAWVVFVLYRREFKSHTLNNLARDMGPD